MKKEIDFIVYCFYIRCNFNFVKRLVSQFPWIVPHQEESDSFSVFFEVPSSLRVQVEDFIPKSRIKYICAYHNSVVYDE